MEKNKETKTLSPKLDVVFQALFGEIGNERITKGFLETILKRKIESIDLSKNPILRREFKDDKLGVLDILAELDGKEKCNIEMQLIDQSNIIERILYYWSRLYTRQIKIGEDYSLLKKTIVILITDFEVKNLKEMDYHSVWKIMDNKTGGKILTDKLEIDIIELPKIKGREKEKDKLLDWLYFLENPKSERVTEKMGENKEIKEVESLVETNGEVALENNTNIKIADDVISVIAGVAVSEVPGVAQMSGGFAGGISEVLSGKKNLAKGIKVDSGEKETKIDVNIIVEYGARIPDVAFEIQNKVKKAVESMTGLKVVEVNVHIQGVSTENMESNNQSTEENQ